MTRLRCFLWALFLLITLKLYEHPWKALNCLKLFQTWDCVFKTQFLIIFQEFFLERKQGNSERKNCDTLYPIDFERNHNKTKILCRISSYHVKVGREILIVSRETHFPEAISKDMDNVSNPVQWNSTCIFISFEKELCILPSTINQSNAEICQIKTSYLNIYICMYVYIYIYIYKTSA